MRKFRVLLAEDDPDHQVLLVRALEESRLTQCVGIARSGKELAALARETDFDCVVCDFRLEDGPASEILLNVRPALGDRPVLIVSSSRHQQTVIAAMRTGCVDFIHKSDAVDGATLSMRVICAIQTGRQGKMRKLRAVRRERNISARSEIDPLTKLHNRYFLQNLRQDLSKGGERRHPSCCILFDIDHFKVVNDNHGHDAGDAVLVAISDLIRSHLSPGDRALRIGGEEILVLRRSADPLENILWAEQLREDIASHPVHVPEQNVDIQITVSAGLALTPNLAHLPDVVHMADESLYLAKRQGRNRVCTHQMVSVLKTAAELRSHFPEADPLYLRQLLLEEILSGAGPVHRHHLVEHSELVGRAAYTLALKMSGSSAVADRVYLAGMLHDIGKIFIPKGLLVKSGPLSRQELTLLASHGPAGAEIVGALTGRADTARTVHDCHVRFDAQLDDALTWFDVQVLAVTDAWVTMIRGREYKAPLTRDQAAAELLKNRGRQFSPNVVDAWMNMRDALSLAA